MSWTDERVETLRRLWGEGLSASQIATELGGVSRNAVIGKVHRLGLEARNKSADDKSKDDAPAVDAAPEIEEEAPAPLEAANDPGSAPDLEDDEDVAPIPLKLKLTELTERTCKWPIGDPMHDNFHFCGHDADEGRPYCEYHSGLAFQPASERRRVR